MEMEAKCNLLMDKVSATFFGFMVLFVPLMCTWLISWICISACRQMESYQEDMCAKCGSIEDAWRVFNKMSSQYVVMTWTAMVLGLAKCGEGQKALDLSQ
jgi:hypothetical protein